jgi:hypothetical protein
MNKDTVNANPIDDIVAVIKELDKKLGVVSTVTADGKPEAAYVYFTTDDDLNVYFATRASSRKYKNLVLNPNVAFVIASEVPPKTIQIEGIAEIVAPGGEQGELFAELVGRIGQGGFSRPIAQMMDSELMFIKVRTNWARLGDFEVVRDEGAFKAVLPRAKEGESATRAVTGELEGV